MTTRNAESEVLSAFVRHEHHDLAAGIERLHETGCELATIPADRVGPRITSILTWFERTVKPHMTWEETWLLPDVDRRAGTPWLAHLVRFDHRQIARRAERLVADRAHIEHGPGPEAIVETRCDLFSIEALLRAHIEREEQFLMPLLAGD